LTPRSNHDFGSPLLLLPLGSVACAQDNHEIQVYPDRTTTEGATMVSLHHDYAAIGGSEPLHGGPAMSRGLHETI